MFQCKHLLFPLFSHTWRDWKVLHGRWWRNAINFFHPSPAHRALQTAAAFLAILSTSQDAFSSTNNGRSIVSEFLLPITKWNRTALCLGFSPTWSDWNAFSQMTTGVQTLEFFAPAPLTFCIETLTSMLIWLGPAQQRGSILKIAKIFWFGRWFTSSSLSLSCQCFAQGPVMIIMAAKQWCWQFRSPLTSDLDNRA